MKVVKAIGKRGRLLARRLETSDHGFGRILGSVYARSLLLPGYWRRLRYRLREGVPPGEIFLRVSPRDIVWVDIDREGRWGIEDHSAPRTIGRVYGGDWDLARSELATWPIYGAIRHLVLEGGDLRDTDYFDNGKRNVRYHSGGIWFRITERNYEKETNRIRRIYERLVREGYRSQREIGSRRILDEIRVKIGRGGEFLFENSIHRMVLARILDLEAIPVVVTIRHAEWDGLRKQLYREAVRVGKTPRHTTNRYPHPDLHKIPYTPSGMSLLREHQRTFGTLSSSGKSSSRDQTEMTADPEGRTRPEPDPEQPKVSVIVTAYNCEPFIADAVRSVLGQTHRNLECIVVDDGSTDGTRRVVEEIRQQDARVRYFYKANGGAASARNFGFARATGDWVQTLDGDDWISPQKVERQLEAVRGAEGSHEGILIYSDYEIVYEDEAHQPIKRTPAVIGGMTRNQLLRAVLGRRFGLATPSPLTMNSMLLSKNICRKHKFDESIQCAEDLEYYYRILQDNLRCIYVPMCSMFYRQNMNSLSKNKYISLSGYTDFLESVLRRNPDHLVYFPNLHKMIRRAYDFGDGQMLERFRTILIRSKIPVYIHFRRCTIDLRLPMALAFRMRFWKLAAKLLLINTGQAKYTLI